MQASRHGLTVAPATTEHVPTIQSMVVNAYSKYTERIGKPPAPMRADYYEVIKTHNVFVLLDKERSIVGSIILRPDPTTINAIQVQNIVVDPNAQGRGYGRVLMDCAESVARSQNCSALVLYTNVKMYENLVLYRKLGFVETGRRNEDGYDRVYFRKDLA